MVHTCTVHTRTAHPQEQKQCRGPQVPRSDGPQQDPSSTCGVSEGGRFQTALGGNGGCRFTLEPEESGGGFYNPHQRYPHP